MFRDIFSTDIWLNATTIISIIYAFYIMSISDNKLMRGNSSIFTSVVVTVFVIFYIGTRPLWCYADTGLYTTIFNLVQTGIWESIPGEGSEPLFAFIENICIELTDASGWLLVIAAIYVSTMVLAAYKWLPRHLLFTIVFLFTAFSFWGYATNGIRHGMATSLSMLGLAFLMSNHRKIILGYIILICAAQTHTSCYLIIGTATLALFYKNYSTYFKIWFLCILLSLVFQEQIKGLFSFFIEDERMTNYLINMQNDATIQYKTGFRWDFILYSSLPILIGWYAVINKGIKDKVYTFILNNYIIANSFWVLINSAAFSNRFAYLSWFLYPILLAYPLSQFKIFKQQSVTTGFVLILSTLFTFLML